MKDENILQVVLISLSMCTIGANIQMWELNVPIRHTSIQNLLKKNLVDLWSSVDDKIQVVVHKKDGSAVEKVLSDGNIEIKIVEEDILSLIEQEEQHLNTKRNRMKRSAGQMDWSSYHRLEDIEGYLGWLNSTQQGRVEVQPVAITEEGRRIHIVRVSNGIKNPSKRKIWIEGGNIQGR